jgi:Cellulase (glycosyl hydrolase family 5)
MADGMENFITGFPGHESQHRAAMKKVLGQENYEFYFDKFLEYFFTDEDAKFLASKGPNCLRLGFNYHHLEDDMNPRVLKEEGFKHMDRVIDIVSPQRRKGGLRDESHWFWQCSKQSIYTILDLHALPGGQNGDWHSDNVTNHASFWDHKDFQDRVVWLWSEISARYKDNPWIAGYNLINEPCDPEHIRLPAFYERIEPIIRDIDPNHILWLDGNTFAMEWRGFDRVLPNSVYALHDYSMMGFPKGERFVSSEEQKLRLERQFLRKAQFMHKNGVPIWNGEFGPVYAHPDVDEEAEIINEARYNLLAEQLRIYDKYKTHWSIWLYKDIGYQGMVYTSPSSRYMKIIAPFQARKRELQLDAWGRRSAPEIEGIIAPLVLWIDKHAITSKEQYPTPWATERQITRLVLQLWVAGCVQDEFTNLFRGMSKEDLDECARAFAFQNCKQRGGLNSALEDHAKIGDATKDQVVQTSGVEIKIEDEKLENK